MIFWVMKKYNIQLFFLIVSCLCSGCAVVRFTTDERLNDKKINKEIYDSFYIDDLEFSLRKRDQDQGSYFQHFFSKDALRKDINQMLIDNFPSNFNRTNGIPLHIKVEYERVCAFSEDSFYSYFPFFCYLLFYYRENHSSHVDISIKIPNEMKSPTTKVDYRYSFTGSMTPLAFFIPGKSSFGARYIFGNDYYDYRDVFVELFSIGIIDAINNLEAHELQVLRESYLVSKDQEKSLRGVISGSTKTIERKINKQGEVEYVEHEHNYQIKENIIQSHFPKIIKQSFDQSRSRGVVVANVTNCSDIESNKYLKEFLIPTICATKNIVFKLNTMEIPAAKFRTIKDVILEEEGNKIREIEFEAVE